jgi:hypothetical protein
LISPGTVDKGVSLDVGKNSAAGRMMVETLDLSSPCSEIREICGYKFENTGGWIATGDLLQKRISALESRFLFAWL